MSRESLNHRDNIRRTPLHIAVDNIEKDAALYHSIREVLQINDALLNSEILEDTRRLELSANISINAVLIATVSFAAGFTLKGGLV
ncbi:hypothetical protein SUGI_0472400 [Cryptomeria japonica]|nr:hypothetical protein SUGI_0472400 [Cryptomeria japonica]